MLVHEIMVTKIVTITPDKSAFDAANLMKKYDIGALPVVQDNKLEGIVTESDIFKRVTSRDVLPTTISVESIMTRKVLTVTKDTKIIDINRLFVNNNIRRIIVVEGEKLIGIVSASDLIRQAYNWEK